jgi:hypothetical protein
MFQETIDHNLAIGLLDRRGTEDAPTLGYSWRGTFYITRQVLQELVFG